MSLLSPPRRPLLMPAWSRDDLWRRAAAVPSLDLNFAAAKALGPLVTFTRASSANYIDSSGTLQTAATDVPRFDHNPVTRESLGLLVEEQRTNSIINNTMVGAVAGTPGTNPTGWIYATTQSNGLTLSIVGTGVENGINYIDYRFNGTTVASPNACAIGFVNATAATAQTWTASMYWKLAAGSATGVTNWQLGLIESTAGGSFVAGAFYSQTAPTSGALITQRPTATRTLSGGATVGLITYPLNIAVAGNTAVDFTLRIGLPQLELGAFATSVILTTTAAATRSADVASITGTNFNLWFNTTQGTIYHQGAAAATGGLNFYSIDDTTANNRITQFMITSTIPQLYVAAAAALSCQIQSSSIAAGAMFAQANAYQASNFAVSTNGGAPGTASSGAVPAVNRMIIGANAASTGVINGTIRRLTYWPQRLPNSTLQQLTA